MEQSFGGFAQRFMTHQEVGHEINEQQLPCGQREIMFYADRTDEQYDGCGDDSQLSVKAVMVVMVVMVLTFIVMMMVCFCLRMTVAAAVTVMLMFVCHIL